MYTGCPTVAPNIVVEIHLTCSPRHLVSIKKGKNIELDGLEDLGHSFFSFVHYFYLLFILKYAILSCVIAVLNTTTYYCELACNGVTHCIKMCTIKYSKL